MTTEITYCENHPDRETALRCNRCNKLICASCAVRTPTGYRCQECIREQRKVFDTAKSQDFIVAFIVAAVLSLIGAFIASAIGFFIFFIFLVGPAAGVFIAGMVQRAVKNRRSRPLFITATAGVVVGGLLPSLPSLYYLLVSGDATVLIGLLWPAVYIVLAATTTYARLAGIQIG